MNLYKTDQENFWARNFGDDYIERNQSDQLYSSNLKFFSSVISKMKVSPTNILELGANVGMNVGPLSDLLPDVEITAAEINSKACEILRSTGCKVLEGSILDLKVESNFDLVFSKGVLIHINPDELRKVYSSLYDNSRRYILVAEYYNPTPTSIDYRGHSDRLFKRDFAGEMLDMYADLELIDYGFCYHRGQFPQDDLTWFLMEKQIA